MILRRRALLLVLSVLLLLAPSSAGAKKKVPVEKGVYADWNELIDTLEIVEPFKLAACTQLMILPLETKTTPLPKSDDNTYAPTKAVLSKATETFVTGVENTVEGRVKVSIVQEPPTVESAQGVLLIRGKVSELNPGSRAARYWGGFGAGKSRVEITGEIVNAETGATLLKFTHARVSTMGGFGGDYATLLSRDLREVGEDIGNMLGDF